MGEGVRYSREGPFGSHVVLEMTFRQRNAGWLFRPTDIGKSVIKIETLLETLAQISMELHHVTGRDSRKLDTITNIQHRYMFIVIGHGDEIYTFRIAVELVC